MIKTTIVKQIDDGKNIYHIGDCVRVKMLPRNPDRPQLASEYIGEIVDIATTTFTLDCIVDNAKIIVSRIDKMRFAELTEDFENTPEF